MTIEIITLEVAESEFERFVESMDLDVDESMMDEDELKSFTRIKKRMLDAMVKGSLIINEDGEAVYTPQNEKSRYQEALTFHERTGATLIATDSKKKNAQASKMYAMMGNICGVAPNVFAGLKGIDVKMCEGIFSLLMD